jgi:hypothetical protein
MSMAIPMSSPKLTVPRLSSKTETQTEVVDLVLCALRRSQKQMPLWRE